MLNHIAALFIGFIVSFILILVIGIVVREIKYHRAEAQNNTTDYIMSPNHALSSITIPNWGGVSVYIQNADGTTTEYPLVAKADLKYKNEICPQCHQRRRLLSDNLLHCNRCNNGDAPIYIIPPIVKSVEVEDKRAIRLSD
jgi:hypothetical protein